jgi:hypothetical protein
MLKNNWCRTSRFPIKTINRAFFLLLMSIEELNGNKIHWNDKMKRSFAYDFCKRHVCENFGDFSPIFTNYCLMNDFWPIRSLAPSQKNCKLLMINPRGQLAQSTGKQNLQHLINIRSILFSWLGWRKGGGRVLIRCKEFGLVGQVYNFANKELYLQSCKRVNNSYISF